MTGYVTGGVNALTSSPGYTYTYDSEGNLTEKTQTSGGTQVTSYAYDARNRMTGATIRASSGGAIVHQVTYTYDAMDRRIGVDTDGTQTWTVYDGQNTYGDFNSSGAVQVRYLYGPAIDAILARTDSGGTSAWYLTDHLGSVRDVVNTSGSVIDHVSYDSFGNILSESNAGNGDRFKYTGRESDAVAGLYFNRARYYDPASGRFNQLDPIAFASNSTNLYAYSANQPVRFVDPSGMDVQDPQGGSSTKYQEAVRKYQEAVKATLKLQAEYSILQRETLALFVQIQNIETMQAYRKQISGEVLHPVVQQEEDLVKQKLLEHSTLLLARQWIYRRLYNEWWVPRLEHLEGEMQKWMPRTPHHIGPYVPPNPTKPPKK